MIVWNRSFQNAAPCTRPHGKRWMVVALVTAGALLLSTPMAAEPVDAASPTSQGYFDPHTHLSGVLPWEAYVSFPAWLAKQAGEGTGPSEADKRAFYAWLRDDWYANQQDRGVTPYASSQRLGLGTRATLEMHSPEEMSADTLDSVLQRLYTATPFTEFDSAYALHKPAIQWQLQTFYEGDAQALHADMCQAQWQALLNDGIHDSEQSVGFIGGWRLDEKGFSSKIADVMCAADGAQSITPALQPSQSPRMRILLMTHTHELGQNAQGDAFQTFEGTGECHWEPLAAPVAMPVREIQNALLGLDAQGRPLVKTGAQLEFFDAVAGIDTAAPEMTCFTPSGMAHYERLISAALRATQTRRKLGWEGKLLVRAHAAENFATYYAQEPPTKPWTFESVFAQVPVLADNVISNDRVATANLDVILDGIEAVRARHPDLDEYIIIRLGHVTYATPEQAQRIADLGVEVDINLSSNLATGSWALNRAPEADRIAAQVADAAADPHQNWALNDVSTYLIPDPADTAAVAAVLASHPLRHMLTAGVRVMLGTDGGGVQHASPARDHALAASLIRHWQEKDGQFARQVPVADDSIFKENVAWHRANMARNKALPYEERVQP